MRQRRKTPVSVPLRGNRRERDGCNPGKQVRFNKFPSPCGVIGVKDLLFLLAVFSLEPLFPSPCGVIGVKAAVFARSAFAAWVSVPLRGNRRESVNGEQFSDAYKKVVSVPLRGNRRESRNTSELIIHQLYSFRPLAG